MPVLSGTASAAMTPHRLSLLLLLVFIGCVSSDVRRQRAAAADLASSIRVADGIDLLSLEPGENVGATSGTFHRYEILGAVPVALVNRSVLAEALGEAVAASRPRMVACFLPRHALRIRAAGAATDVVICFECSTLYVKREGSSQRFNVESSPETLLDSWLDAAGVARAVSPSGGS